MNFLAISVSGRTYSFYFRPAKADGTGRQLLEKLRADGDNFNAEDAEVSQRSQERLARVARSIPSFDKELLVR
jgi:hypothetical protein